VSDPLHLGGDEVTVTPKLAHQSVCHCGHDYLRTKGHPRDV